MAELLKGFKVIKALQKDLYNRTNMLKAENVIPTLAIVRVGDREDDMAYERNAIKRCNDVGIIVKPIVLDKNIETNDLISINCHAHLR